MRYAPPTWQAWLQMLAVLGFGWACLGAGVWSVRRGRRGRNAAALAGTLTAVAGIAAYHPVVQDLTGPLFALAGGEGVPICFGALVLLGVAWGAREQPVRRPLLVLCAVMAFFAVATFDAGSLAWCYLGERLRGNYPDARGVIQQTTGVTCAPAAAAMLLHRGGVRVSEGDLAQLAGTHPLLGTFEHRLAAAVGRVARPNGLKCRIRRLTYPQARRLGRPFIAFVDRPRLGGHAILVETVDAQRVWTVDPYPGGRVMLPRARFEREWDRRAVWLEEDRAAP